MESQTKKHKPLYLKAQILTNTNIVKQLEIGNIKAHVMRKKKKTEHKSDNVEVRRDSIEIGTRHDVKKAYPVVFNKKTKRKDTIKPIKITISY